MTFVVQCIQEKAEELIAASDRAAFMDGNFTLEYYSMKYSGSPLDTLEWEVDNLTNYLNITLTKDRGFYSIPVNTEHSAVRYFIFYLYKCRYPYLL